MSAAAHTPGPWATKHREGADGMYRTEVFSEQHGGIATCEWTPKNLGNGVTGTYREANARLIAAAPDHALVAKAMTAGKARWEPATNELCFGGFRYSTRLDQFGIPSLDEMTRPGLERLLAGSAA